MESWGNKPTPPGTSSKPLPPPVASYEPVAMAGAPQGFTAAELLDYQRQLALSQAVAEHPAGQHILVGYVPAGLLTADTQALYDGYLNQSSAQWCSLGREDGSRHVTRCIDREKIAALLKFRDWYFLMVVLEIVYLAAVLT